MAAATFVTAPCTADFRGMLQLAVFVRDEANGIRFMHNWWEGGWHDWWELPIPATRPGDPSAPASPAAWPTTPRILRPRSTSGGFDGTRPMLVVEDPVQAKVFAAALSDDPVSGFRVEPWREARLSF